MIKCKAWFNINSVTMRRLEKAHIEALEKTAEAIHTDVIQAQRMPWATGHLQNEATSVDYQDSRKGTVTIVSATPYARRLYFHPEYHFNVDENPNAGGEWYKDYFPGGRKEDFAQKAFATFFRRASGV